MVQSSHLDVKVWGEFACFTRPELKVERVSYPVLTPSAARGVLEAIFWKPQFTWIVREIWVLKPIEYFSIMRNEINSRQTARTAQDWARRGQGGFYAPGDHTPRHTLALRDVAYVIKADIELHSDVTDNIAKYRDQFRRRVQRGRCFSAPYLGCREFTAHFEPPGQEDRPLDISGDLGRILLGLEYPEGALGPGVPRFFAARLDAGVLQVPAFDPRGAGGHAAAKAA